jgi:hypothetical protein
VKPKVIPIITETNETIPKSLRKYLSNVLVEHETRKHKKPPYSVLHTYFGN